MVLRFPRIFIYIKFKKCKFKLYKILTFRYKSDTDTFYKLFNAYTKTLDSNDVIRTGMISYNKVDRDGKFVGTLAKYILIIVFGSFIAILFIKKKSRNIKKIFWNVF